VARLSALLEKIGTEWPPVNEDKFKKVAAREGLFDIKSYKSYQFRLYCFFDKIFEKARESDAFRQEMAILGFTEAVSERLASLDVSRTDLAQKLRSCPSFVTKLMRGKNNFTIRTMVT
jgi:hypothetical protein